MVALTILPGMDGTGALLRDFVSALGPGFETTVVSYPPDRALGYSELESLVRSFLPTHRPYVLLGESFSGPLAVSIAAARPAGLMALVLSCSFVRNPRPVFGAAWPILRLFPHTLAPTWLLDACLLGRFSSPDRRSTLRKPLVEISKAALRARLQAVVDIDVSRELPKLGVPVLYLRGAEDRLVPRSCSEAIARDAPQVQIVDIEAPHFLLQVAPSAAAAAVKDFVRTVAPSAAREA